MKEYAVVDRKTGITYNGFQEASEATGVCSLIISGNCRNAGKFRDVRFVFADPADNYKVFEFWRPVERK